MSKKAFILYDRVFKLGAQMMKWLALVILTLSVQLTAHELVNLREYNPYFCFGGNGEAFLVKEAAMQLSRVQRDLAKEGIALVILRAYLPESQSPARFADVDQDLISKTFSRGTAVDVTMEYLSGNPLLLPCPPYTLLADCPNDCDFPSFNPACTCSLQKLESIMMRHGFVRSSRVWWHFDYRYWRTYPPLNIPVQELLFKKCRQTKDTNC